MWMLGVPFTVILSYLISPWWRFKVVACVHLCLKASGLMLVSWILWGGPFAVASLVQRPVLGLLNNSSEGLPNRGSLIMTEMGDDGKYEEMKDDPRTRCKVEDNVEAT